MHGPSDLVEYWWEFYVWSKPLGVVEDGGIGDKLLLLGERSVRRPTGTKDTYANIPNHQNPLPRTDLKTVYTTSFGRTLFYSTCTTHAVIQYRNACLAWRHIHALAHPLAHSVSRNPLSILPWSHSVAG
jgi:hypothetical protein